MPAFAGMTTLLIYKRKRKCCGIIGFNYNSEIMKKYLHGQNFAHPIWLAARVRYRKINMKHFILLTISALIVSMAIVIFLSYHRDKTVTSVDYIYQITLSLNAPFEESNIEITALQINKSRQCLIQIKNLSTDEIKSGWLGEGEFVSFAPKEVGTSGLQLHEISEKNIILNFRYGYTK